MTASGFDPSRLDVGHLAELGAHREGHWPGARMARLATDTLGPPGPVSWAVTGERRRDGVSATQTWLHLSCSCAVELTCQRCLQPVRLELQVERAIRFVRDEAEAERLDEESEDDVLAWSPQGLDLEALIEDELILAVPLVPRHDDCPNPLPQPREEEAEARPNPFEALAALKRPPSSGSG